MADTTRTYPHYPRSNFPEQVDDFALMQDPNAYQMSIIRQYEALIANGDVDGAAALLKQNPELDKSLFNAQKFNHLSDGLKATQQFFKDDVETYVKDLFQRSVGIDDNAEGDAKLTNTYSAQKIDSFLAEALSFIKINLLASKWVGSAPPYTQTVANSNINPFMNPALVRVVDANADINSWKAYNKAFGIISGGKNSTENGAVKFSVLKKPQIDIVVGLKGV